MESTLFILGSVPSIKIRENLTEAEAYDLEEIFVAAIGRYPDGPLINIASGGATPKGVRWSKAARLRQSEMAKARGVSEQFINAPAEARRRANDARWAKEGERERASARMSALKTITDGTRERRINEDDAPPEGWVLGRSLTAKEKIAAAAKTQNLSVQVEAMRLANIGRPNANPERIGNLWRGKKLPEELRAKLSAAAIRRWQRVRDARSTEGYD